MDIFFEKYANDEERKGSVNSSWSIIKNNFPSWVHYEFHCTKKNGVDIAFHIEDDKYKNLVKVLKKFENKKVYNKIVEFDHNWNKGNRKEGLGQILVKFGHEYIPEEVAESMRKFIDMTYREIEKGIESIDKNKKNDEQE